jgi:hypothetical protein
MGFGMTDSCLINYVIAGSYLAASNNTITISGYIPSSRARFSKIKPEKSKPSLKILDVEILENNT